MRTLNQLWAPFDLRITAGPLALSTVTDADLPALVDLVERGIHDPARMPFSFPWTDAPAAELPGNFAAYHWRNRAEFSPAEWRLDLIVRCNGEPVGVQGISTRNYLVVRSGETGSWLGRDYQGHGIGTTMRQVLCAFVFDHLDAQQITSAAFTDNPASLAVSRKVGYRDNGESREQRRPGELATMRRLVLAPGDLVRGEHPVEVSGVEPLRTLIGL
ncbi:MAG: GNAT family N-acetyltransferase [Jatrophihabitans sp.]